MNTNKNFLRAQVVYLIEQYIDNDTYAPELLDMLNINKVVDQLLNDKELWKVINDAVKLYVEKNVTKILEEGEYIC